LNYEGGYIRLARKTTAFYKVTRTYYHTFHSIPGLFKSLSKDVFNRLLHDCPIVLVLFSVKSIYDGREMILI